MDSTNSNEIILLDTHAHYYPFCTLPEYFNSVYSNMQAAAGKHNHADGQTLVICLLETETSHWYQDFLSHAKAKNRIGEWQIEALDNDQHLRLKAAPEREFLILPGQQIITSEKLEVIIIGSPEKITHHKPAPHYIEKYSGKQLVIIPWGVGKWLGARGRVVSKLIQQYSNKQFALGDNSGRPSVWQYVPQFNQAKLAGINILAGSDPLPIAGQQRKTGSYGSIITGPLDHEGLANQLREKLLNTNSIRHYGRLDGLIRFVVSQLLLRFRRID